MKNILVDIDGVVAQYDFPRLVRTYFGTEITSEDVTAHDLETCFGVARIWIDKMFEVEVWKTPEFISWARPLLNYLKLGGFNILIFSNRVKYMGVQKLWEWLVEHNIPHTGIATWDTLPDEVYAHIDDSPNKLMEVNHLVDVKHSILFTQPWNIRCLNITGKMERADNWHAVRRIIDEG